MMNKIYFKKEHNHPMFIAALFTITKVWKQSKCPSADEWIKQLWDIYTIEHCSAVKRKKILLFARVWMENVKLIKISQSEKDKYYMISLICGI